VKRAWVLPPWILIAFGWLAPGGAYLLTRCYTQFALFAGAVWLAFGAGVALHGVPGWPRAEEIAGIDGVTALLFQAGAVGQALAGAPYLLARVFGSSEPFLVGRLHEYGTTLLVFAGVLNTLAISSAIDLRKERGR
jgi:hypothetical protein